MLLLAQAPTVQDVAQGPFAIAGQSFNVVSSRTRVEIRDTAGAAQYQKLFLPQENVSASARLVSAGGLAGLLVRYVRSGSAESWQLFRLKDGKLALLDLGANTVTGPLGAFAVARGGAAGLSLPVRGDDFEMKIWTGNFYVIAPARVNWQQGVISKGAQCFEGNGSGGLVEHGCDMRVEAVRKPITTDLSFVRLLQEPKEGFGYARHLVLKRDSKVEYLGARAIVNWTKNGDEVVVRVSDLWLKILVDNNEENLGWIHSQEDFSAAGLPAVNAP